MGRVIPFPIERRDVSPAGQAATPASTDSSSHSTSLLFVGLIIAGLAGVEAVRYYNASRRPRPHTRARIARGYR